MAEGKKLFRVTITELDPETKAPKETHVDENYISLALVAECDDGQHMAEVVLNDSPFGIAKKLAMCEKLAPAAGIASLLLDLKMRTDDKKDATTKAVEEIKTEG